MFHRHETKKEKTTSKASCMKNGKFAFITHAHTAFSTLLILTLPAGTGGVSHTNLTKWPSSLKLSLQVSGQRAQPVSGRAQTLSITLILYSWTFTRQNEHCDWFILGHVPLIKSKCIPTGIQLRSCCLHAILVCVFAIRLFKGKSKYITKHLRGSHTKKNHPFLQNNSVEQF